MLNIKTLKPLFTGILTTGDCYTEDMRTGGVIVANKGDLKPYQKVLAIGSTVRDIKEGDQVMIDLSHFAVMKLDPNSIKKEFDMDKVVRWNIPWITVKGKECLLINDRDVKFVFEGEETNEPLIMPEKPKIITMN